MRTVRYLRNYADYLGLKEGDLVQMDGNCTYPDGTYRFRQDTLEGKEFALSHGDGSKTIVTVIRGAAIKGKLSPIATLSIVVPAERRQVL